jgi:hypothetical protein
MFQKIKTFWVNDEELGIEWQRLLSIIFLFLAGIMSFITYTHMGWLWNTKLTFAPSFISTIGGTMLIAPLYLRDILKWNRSIYTIISFLLILLVFSSFLEIITGGKGYNNITYSLIGISIVLSWLEIKGVAGVSWILTLDAAIYHVITSTLALGFNGYIYVSSGFLGLVLHTGLNPGALVKGLKEEYTRSVSSAVNVVKGEIAETGTMINTAK